ncbi:MAG TPA: UbiH/UbiF/VisC/COQ6 family ubiquinone biosynthesis hydroxylase [Burkholderiales bacterium]
MSGRRAQAPVHYDVAIVGGGMVGGALACALGGSALKVALIEPNPPRTPAGEDFEQRVSALTLASQAFLENVGAWAGVLARRAAEVRAMRVWDAWGEIHFDAAEIGEPYLAHIVENAVVVAALYERMQQHTNVHVVHDRVAGFALEEEAVTLALADGRRLRARLAVGADGADSAVRRALGIPVRRLDMRQLGIVATVRTEGVHRHTAWQRFLPTGPLAFLPLPDAHACSIVWSADRERADALLALDDAAFLAALAEAFGDRLGRLRSVGPRAAFPLALAHADSYVRQRAALVGDAAHVVHPLAGQGVNLGLLDAAALAEVLLEAVDARRDIGGLHVLRRYERRRKGDNLAMVAVTGGFRYLFGNDWPLLRSARGLGLSLTNRLGLVKWLIMRRASGLDGDLPRLARRGL